MKKIFTLLAATLFTLASFAADRRPVVMVKAPRNYDIEIDGRMYSGMGFSDIVKLGFGQHIIKVYDAGRGGYFGFRRQRRAVDVETFYVDRNDINITVNFNGQICVDQVRNNGWYYGNDRDDRNRDRDFDRDDHGRGRDRDDRDYRDRDNDRRF